MPDTSLNDLDPTLRALAQEWLDECIANGLDVKITETWRDPAREDALHAQGITVANGNNCEHCTMVDGKPASRAFDFACFRNHVYITHGEDVAYAAAGQIAQSLGLVYGGNFSHPDFDHIEMPAGPITNIISFPGKV